MAQKKKSSSDNNIARNRRAKHDYLILETFEAGLALTGTEVKSARNRQVSLQHSYIQPRGKELFLVGANIAPYLEGSHENHDPERPRKLLLKRREIDHIQDELQTKGLTVIPIRMYLKKGWAKLEIGIAKGKKLYDKRQDLKEQDAKRQIERALRAKYG